LNTVKAADVIYLVLRAFESPDVTSYEEGIDVVRDLQAINMELMLYVSGWAG
jgi:ribosome-binding ATPase YchF (GTP1/OBG family)